MADIVELAQRLGKAINESPQAAALRAARAALSAEAEVTQLLKEYQDQADRIAQQEQDQKPVEVDDKHKLQALQDKLFGAETFKKFTAAQVEYVDMMRQVNAALREQLMETEGE